MYLSPFVAVALFWRSQSVTANLAGDAPDGGPTAWSVLKDALSGRVALLRPVAAAAVASVLLVMAAEGFAAGVAFAAGAAFAVVFAVLARASMLSAVAHGVAEGSNADWAEGSGIALGLASLVAGGVGAFAWFFADPSGAIVLVAFLLGASSAGLFVALTGGAPADESSAASYSPNLRSIEASIWSAPAPMHVAVAAVASALMVASTAEPGTIVGFGSPGVEPETLRSELLLLPVTITLVSPVVAMLTATLVRRAGTGEYFLAERVAALLTAFVVVAVVLAGGLSTAVSGALLAGLAARQALLLRDEQALRARRSGRVIRGGSSFLPAFVAAVAVGGGFREAGAYGVALVALGMSATYATASACGIARDLHAIRARLPRRAGAGDAGAGDTAGSLAATLALLVASGPVLVAESLHRGMPVDLAVTAAPSLLLGAVVGAAAAGQWSQGLLGAATEQETVRMAALAVVATVALPALAGMLFGSGAAFGAALGFAAWAAATSPSPSPAEGEDASTMRRGLTLAWARTMALAALVVVPLMN